MFKILKYLKKYTFEIILSTLFITLQALLNLYLPDLMSDIVNKGVIHGRINYIIHVGIKMLLITLLSVVAAIIASFFASRISMKFGKDLRDMLFRKVMHFSFHEIDQFGTASLITRNTNDITQIQQAVFMTLRMVVQAPVMAIGGIVMAVSKSTHLTMVLLVSIPILLIGFFFIIGKVSPLFRSMQKKIDNINRILRENLIGVRVIRAFARTRYEKDRFEVANEDLTQTALRVYRLSALIMPFVMFIMNFTIIFIIWIGGIEIDKGRLQIGNMMAVMQYIIQIMMSFVMISIISMFLPRAGASAERVEAVLSITPEIKEPRVPIVIENGKGIISFKDVTFYYPGAREPALKAITFDLYPGQTIGIIGASGSGKTTLLNLLMRFYDIKEGKILIDSVNIKDFPQKVLRKRMAYVPSRPVIFSGTIRDNIRIGKEDATDKEIIRACKIAQAWEFISKMPEGLDTVISQGGTNLSGGQKQRLAIARAIVGKKDIYLFDDAFSALDFKTDANLRYALKNQLKGATMIIVSLRVATIMNADRIIVLHNGEIVGLGRHKELFEECMTYREIVLSQLSEEELQ